MVWLWLAIRVGVCVAQCRGGGVVCSLFPFPPPLCRCAVHDGVWVEGVVCRGDYFDVVAEIG